MDFLVNMGSFEKGELPSLKTRLEQLSTETSQHSIYRVPRHLRDVNKKAYEPQIVAIGPYYRGQHELKKMEELKLRYMKQLLDRRFDVPFEDYISAIEGMSKRARDCYEEPPIDLKDNEFTDMLVLDGCFIIQLIIQGPKLLSSTFPDRSSLGMLQRDLILLENQIPFFVVCKLFDLIVGPHQHSLLMELILKFCQDVFPEKILYKATTRRSPEEVQHILDLIHSNWCPPYNSSDHHTISLPVDDQGRCASWCRRASTTIFSSSGIPSASELKDANLMFRHKEYDTPPNSCDHHVISEAVEGCYASWCRRASTSSSVIPSASELKDANVKFRNKEYDSPPDPDIIFREDRCTSLFDVEFNNSGKMVMPTLVIDDWTERLLRNLIAYEQLFPEDEPTYVTDYTILLDCLINTSKDVQILCRGKIIENLLGSDQEVVDFVNKLCYGVTFNPDTFIYADTFRRINAHHKRCWNRAVAAFHRDYFHTPWAYIAFLGAFILFLLTAAQTIFSALQVV